MRLVDYLQTRADVDGTRIGMIGISKGGMETYLAAAADPRIAVAVPVIGVQSFRWALEHDAWQSRVETILGAVAGAARDGLATGRRRVRAARSTTASSRASTTSSTRPRCCRSSRRARCSSSTATRTRSRRSPASEEAATAAERAYRSARARQRSSGCWYSRTPAMNSRSDAQRAALDWLVRWLKP